MSFRAVEHSSESIFVQAFSRFGGLFKASNATLPVPRNMVTDDTQRRVVLMDTGLVHGEHEHLVQFNIENEQNAAEMRYRKIMEGDKAVRILDSLGAVPWASGHYRYSIHPCVALIMSS